MSRMSAEKSESDRLLNNPMEIIKDLKISKYIVVQDNIKSRITDYIVEHGYKLVTIII